MGGRAGNSGEGERRRREKGITLHWYVCLLFHSLPVGQLKRGEVSPNNFIHNNLFLMLSVCVPFLEGIF